VLNRPEGQCVFIDTPGFLSKRHRGELCRFINGAITQASQEMDFSVLVVDANRAHKEKDLAERLNKSLRDKNIPRPKIIALNKVDLVSKPKLLPTIQGFYEEFNGRTPDEQPTRVLPISARRGDGVEEFVDLVFDFLPQGHRYFPDEVSSDQPEEFFVTEIIREKLFRQLNQELPYAIAVQLEGLEERGDLLSIGCKIIVESPSQRGIVLGKQGAKVKAIGISARKELESLFGMKVDLRLFVKVEKDWTKTQQGMARVGYVKGSTYTVSN
jgi:GTP-binding protein Era